MTDLVKFQLLSPTSKAPIRGSGGAACYDMYANTVDFSDQFVVCKTGVAVDMPQGFVGLLFPRSSVTGKGLMLGNAVGVIDSDYKQEVIAKFVRYGNLSGYYTPGERCCQLMFVWLPDIELQQVEKIMQNGRGSFGSTGA